MKREYISKKLRFEIFKRDAFTCQYCGRHPPEVVLEVDHVLAVSKGGRSDELNLLTSCFDCNRGKGSGDILDALPSMAERLAAAAEQQAQLVEYEKILREARLRIRAQSIKIGDVLAGKRLSGIRESAFVSIKTFVEKLGYEKVLRAAESTAYRVGYSNLGAASEADGYDEESDRRFRYFCGFCWNLIRDQNDPRGRRYRG